MKDLQGNNTAKLLEKKLFLFDMDGTIYSENRVFEGTLAVLNLIKKNHGKYVFITNNSSKSVDDYITKVTKMKIPACKDDFFTSSQATAIYLLENYKDQTIYCMGTKSFLKELTSFGIKVTVSKQDKPAAVVVGFDTELTYEKLRDTCELLFQGLPYIATNPDRACPVNFGFTPDCGAICEAIYFATSRRPLYIGKPETTMIDYALRKSGFSKEQTVVVGDRLYTDIACGVNAGITTICVLSGETKIADIQNSNIKPDFIFNDISDILSIYI